MCDAERFDAFYADARTRLLVQAFALTGDLPASRGAVRDAFVAAWHRWPKIRRLDDPEGWVRPRAWTHAQRRHTTRIWHRDRRLDPEVRATLEALARLPVSARRALLLTQLTNASREQMAREVGLPLPEAERRLQTATTQLSLHRNVSTTALRPLFDQLAATCADERWPRATIIRRAGSARRRTHALAGGVLVVLTLVGSGLLVQDAGGVHPTLASARDRLLTVPAHEPSRSSSPTTPAVITPASLLTPAQVSGALPGHTWRVTGTDPGQGATVPCQKRHYADPHAETTLVRNFTSQQRQGQGQATMAAVQSVEYSTDSAGAARGFTTAAGWFAGCLMPQTQLLSVHRVSGLGDEAEQYALRAWRRPAVTLVLGLARTGRATTVTVTRAAGSAAPDLAANMRLMVSAVDNLCGTSAGGPCSAMPRSRVVPVPPAGPLPMMLSEFDLPPAAGVQQPWAGTTPRRALDNLAATGCDQSSFHGHGWTHDATRSFVAAGANLSTAFGLTETIGVLPAPKAIAFVAGVRAKLDSCPSRELGTKVERLASTTDLTAWRVRTQVTHNQTVTFLMGIVRNGGAVAQVGFVPDGTHTLTTPQFVAVVARAGERLSAMP
jgi:DNA-directed RNA polymerase specialized sigma24 family protein